MLLPQTRLFIADVKTVRDLCLSNFESGNRDYKIGSIISVEHRPIAPKQPYEAWRLAETSSAGIPRHHTELFYTEGNHIDAIKDMFKLAHPPDWVNQKLQSLSKTLDFAKDFYASNCADTLVIHCIRGIHRSPLLATAILCHMHPDLPADQIIDYLFQSCLHPPQLRTGELAFVDAFFSWDGDLISTWLAKASGRNNPKGKFDETSARKLQKHFYELIGPRQPKQKDKKFGIENNA